jgi:hypothetical protein
VTIVSSQTVDEERVSDGRVVVARNRAIHIVHDLTCGGTWVDLAPGDRVEIKGEYVAPPNGGDLIHFTHADAVPETARLTCASGKPARARERGLRRTAAQNPPEPSSPCGGATEAQQGKATLRFRWSENPPSMLSPITSSGNAPSPGSSETSVE